AGDYDAIVDTIGRLVADVESEFGPTSSIGIGTPGAIVPATGLLRNSNSVVLNEKRLTRDIEGRLGRAVRIANDANCLALSEAVDGAGAGHSVVFAAILGTGVGGGIAVDRRVIDGRNRIAGEWGHNALPWPKPSELPGPACYCGKRGCLETFLSGPAFTRAFDEMSGRVLAPTEIATAAERSDRDAASAMAAYEDRLARGLAHVVNILDPDVIVVGGGISKIARLYRNVPSLIQRYVVSQPVAVTMVPALHGDSSGVRGAAWL
ncbi:MAG TPA: ROK family protein, partial [Candidatus Dormibacteraeota bacterium]|nr:ROK family protein [Candidatus Dormibacteraeota bacterium]